MSFRWALGWLPLLPVSSGAVVLSAWAQQPTTAPDSVRAAACTGASVSEIEYARRPPPIVSDRVPGALRSVLRFAIQHRQTVPEAIEPFVLLRVGDTCDMDRVVETERMLRAQPYLANAAIEIVPLAERGVRLIVTTTDEIPLVIGGRWRDDRPSSFTYGNDNLGGRGMSARLRWDEGFAYRDGFGSEFAHYHLIGRSTARFAAIRGTLDEHYGAQLTRAYLTDAQNTAWHIGTSRREGFADFLRNGGPPIALELDREVVDAGVLLRVGSDRRRIMVGLIGSYEHVMPGSRGVVLADTGFALDPDTTLTGRFSSWRDTRVGAVVSARWIDYTPVIGLDSSGGRQDVPTGAQFALTAGHGVTGDRRDPFASLDFYTATTIGGSLLAFHMISEGRRSARFQFSDVVAGGQIAWYSKPSRRRTRMVRAEYGGAWHMTLPLQLSLADRIGGVRGYRGADEAGSQRAVVRYEERFSLGGMWGVAGVGIAGFTDVGKVRAGDVPFGVSTAVRPSVGVALLAAVPRQSQRLIRLDVAVPLIRNSPTRSWSMRIGSSLHYEAFWREPPDLRRMRAIRPASELLVWR